jgi:hypothetical protein
MEVMLLSTASNSGRSCGLRLDDDRWRVVESRKRKAGSLRQAVKCWGLSSEVNWPGKRRACWDRNPPRSIRVSAWCWCLRLVRLECTIRNVGVLGAGDEE